MAEMQMLIQSVEIARMISDTKTTKMMAYTSIQIKLNIIGNRLNKRPLWVLVAPTCSNIIVRQSKLTHFLFYSFKQFMRALFAFAIFFFFAGTACINSFQTDICPCLNEGTCKFDEAGVRYCTCLNDYIGTNCEEPAISLTKLGSPANITEEYKYFFIQFNASTLFYVEIFFCPLEFDPKIAFDVQIEFEDETGSMEQLIASKSHTLHQKQKQCAIAKYVILPFKKRANGEFIRLIVRIRQKFNQSAVLKGETNSSEVSQLNIKYLMYQFYKLNGQSIGELMVISTLSSMLLICISLTICRRILLRRGPRFIYQPAVVVRDISSFDDFMPPILYPIDPETRQEEKQCMICLLNVENTLTRTTPCRHLFHKECIDEWGRKSLTCPMCRYPLERERASSV